MIKYLLVLTLLVAGCSSTSKKKQVRGTCVRITKMGHEILEDCSK